MAHYILTIDAGTTGVQVSLFDTTDFTMHGNNKISFTQHFPHPGYVEHDPNEIWNVTCQSIEQACNLAKEKNNKFSKNDICGIGITNQRETCLAWNLATHESPFHAIVWQDRRTANACDKIKKNHSLSKKIHKITGLVADPYFSATKMRWILYSHEIIQSWAKKRELALGTIDSFLIWKLTNHKMFVTDHTNASRTMLYDLQSGDYNDDLLTFFRIKRHYLAKILPSIGEFGKTKNLSCLPDGIPICSTLGDQQAALYGQLCTRNGNSKITFGTGAFILMNTGVDPISSSHGLLTTVACSTTHKRTFALEGSAFIAGDAMRFMADTFGWFQRSAESEDLAIQDDRDENILFIPALAGLGSPYWNPHAKGTLFGLTRGATKSQIARSILEGIALQNILLMKYIQKDSGMKISKLCVDGGGSANNFMMQFQADVFQTKLIRPSNIQTTSLGVALAAYEALYRCKPSYHPSEKIFFPKMAKLETKKIIHKWMQAVECINEFYSAEGLNIKKK